MYRRGQTRKGVIWSVFLVPVWSVADSFWTIGPTHSEPSPHPVTHPPLLRRHSSADVWHTARRTASTFTSCARTPTSSRTWDGPTPPAPSSPPSHHSRLTDGLCDATAPTPTPSANLKAGLFRLEDKGCGCFCCCFYLSWSKMDSLAAEMKKDGKDEVEEGKVLGVRCSRYVCCTESGPWTQLGETWERKQEGKGGEKKRGSCV